MFAFILSVCVCVVFTKLGLAEAAASKQKTTTNRIEEEQEEGISGREMEFNTYFRIKYLA